MSSPGAHREAYLESSRTSTMKLFCENNNCEKLLNIQKTLTTNFALKYAQDKIQTVIGDGKVVNIMAAIGLDSIYLKTDDES